MRCVQNARKAHLTMRVTFGTASDIALHAQHKRSAPQCTSDAGEAMSRCDVAHSRAPYDKLTTHEHQTQTVMNLMVEQPTLRRTKLHVNNDPMYAARNKSQSTHMTLRHDS